MTMKSPREFARDYCFRWEDGKQTDPAKTHSLDPDDNGNWHNGILIGSNHGVTPAALAEHRGVSINSITRAIMRALTLDEAADIALEGYFIANKLNLLPWNAVTASIMDFGWGAGKFTAVQYMQRMIGVTPDFHIGPATIQAYAKWLASRTIEQAAAEWAKIRYDHYERVIAAKPVKAKYRKGWRARTDYFTPGEKEGWWNWFYGIVAKTMPTLREGDRGEDVKTLQRLIGANNVDGIFGPATTKIVKAKQAAAGLAVDGIVGPATWSVFK